MDVDGYSKRVRICGKVATGSWKCVSVVYVGPNIGIPTDEMYAYGTRDMVGFTKGGGNLPQVFTALTTGEIVVSDLSPRPWGLVDSRTVDFIITAVAAFQLGSMNMFVVAGYDSALSGGIKGQIWQVVNNVLIQYLTFDSGDKYTQTFPSGPKAVFQTANAHPVLFFASKVGASADNRRRLVRAHVEDGQVKFVDQFHFVRWTASSVLAYDCLMMIALTGTVRQQYQYMQHALTWEYGASSALFIYYSDSVLGGNLYYVEKVLGGSCVTTPDVGQPK